LTLLERMLVMRTIALVAALSLAGAAMGQAPPTDRPWAFLSANPDEPGDRAPAAAIRNVLLRPNVEMGFHVYVHNPTDNPQDVTVVVASGPGEADEIARSAVRAAAKSTVRVPAPKAAAGTPPDKPPPSGPVRSGLHLRVLDKNGDVIDRTPAMPVRIQVPSQYVEPTVTFQGEPGAPENRLTVTIKDRTPARPFAGPPAKVQLVLSPDRIPGLIPESARDGTFQGEVPPGGEAVLVANNLQFRGADRQGVIVVNVDGYDRAFLFTSDFGGTAPQPYGKPDLKIVAPQFAEPAKPVPVRLEIDNPPRSDAVAEFGIDRSGAGNFVTKRFPSGEREESVTVRWGGPAGGLSFVTKVGDRVEMLNPAGIFGTRQLRLRLLYPRENQLVELNPPAPVFTDVVFDESKPVVTDFSVRSKELLRNKPVTLQAIGTDPESGISEVVFFLGDPPSADGKPAANGRVFPGTPPNQAGGPYTVTIPLGDAKLVKVGVRFTNPLGMFTDRTAELEPTDPPEPKKTGTIKGTVVQGSPERLQKNVPVKLADPKGMEVKSGATTDKGEFTFEDVPPGKYIVAASIPRDRTTAKGEVTVEAGKTVTLKLILKR
jgi:hypothetical protein